MVQTIPRRPSAFIKKAEVEPAEPTDTPPKDNQTPPTNEGEALAPEPQNVEPEVQTEQEIIEPVEPSPLAEPVDDEPEDEPENQPSDNDVDDQPEPLGATADTGDGVDLPDLDTRGDPDNVRFFVKGSHYDGLLPRPYEGVLAKYQTPAEYRIAMLYPKLISKVMKVTRSLKKNDRFGVKVLMYRWQCWLMPVRGKDGFERIELNKKYVESTENRTLKKTRLPMEPTGFANAIKPRQAQEQ